MGKEIEAKFLVKENGFIYTSLGIHSVYPTIYELIVDVNSNGKPIKQGYLPLDVGMTAAQEAGLIVDFTPDVARLREKAGKYFLTIKGKGDTARDELETKIDAAIFNTYWPKTEGQRVEKVRLEKTIDGYTAEIDVFTDRDLILAEIEVNTEEELKRIPILGKDVSTDPKYKNNNLA